jgi:hypothetical protein
MKYVRVRPYSDGGPCAVRHPEHGELVVPDPAQVYRADDPIVTAFPWLFVSDADLAERGERPAPTSVEITTATARPGTRRLGRRA